MHMIDRRLNPGGRSLVNRQRFLRRARGAVQQAVRASLKDRSIKDIGKEGQVAIPTGGIGEPTLHRAASGGNRERVFPGNRDFLEGDRVKRPEGGGAAGSEAGEGDGEDQFHFVLSREEFLELFLDDLELPDLAKRRLVGEESDELRRAGYTTMGSPANLSMSRTMQRALSRRLALRRPKRAELEVLETKIALAEEGEEQSDRIGALRAELERLRRRRALISWIDPVDLRYRRFAPVPRPTAQAVMFCLMDVSGSMSEHMKDLAKRFFALLHLFLTRCYRHVELVFIHHTDHAAEVDENTFFHSQVTGGTLVSTALDELLKVIAARYRPEDWNVYVAQASDGDNLARDNSRSVQLLHEVILPLCQYYAYIEVGAEEPSMAGSPEAEVTSLWAAFESIAAGSAHFAMRKVHHRREIYPVLHELFRKRGALAPAEG
jgi:uncharacterized sporulation protein YeaH/YhbH (DUF444 family)